MEEEEKEVKKGGNNVWIIIGAIISLIFILATGGFGGGVGKHSNKELMQVTEILVLQDQFQPNNATFTKRPKVKKIGKDNWEVKGRINSQDAYGVFLEMNYTLRMEYDKDTELFYATYLDYSY